jgi:hypothetical protein
MFSPTFLSSSYPLLSLSPLHHRSFDIFRSPILTLFSPSSIQRLLSFVHDTALCPQSPYSARPIHISAHRVYPEPSSTSVASSLEQRIRLTRDHPHRSPPSVYPLRHIRAASRTLRVLSFAAPTPRHRRLRITSRARSRAVAHQAQFLSPSPCTVHIASTPVLRPAFRPLTFLPLSTIPVCSAAPSTTRMTPAIENISLTTLPLPLCHPARLGVTSISARLGYHVLHMSLTTFLPPSSPSPVFDAPTAALARR